MAATAPAIAALPLLFTGASPYLVQGKMIEAEIERKAAAPVQISAHIAAISASDAAPRRNATARMFRAPKLETS
jgi:hypothetical protein